MEFFLVLIFVVLIIIIPVLISRAVKRKKQEELERQYRELETEVLNKLNFSGWDIVSYIDDYAIVKSRQALENYDDIRFFKENPEKLIKAKQVLERKSGVLNILEKFLLDNEYTEHLQYSRLIRKIKQVIEECRSYRVRIIYRSSAGNHLGNRRISINQRRLEMFENDPSLLMSKGEYNKYIKEQQKEALNQKQHMYYESVNKIIDYANEHRESLFIKDSKEQLDNFIAQLFDRTVNGIKKVKSIDSDEWEIISNFVSYIGEEIEKIVRKNQRILEYYASSDFLKIKETCEVLMSTQREFNEYINEKVEAISRLFGTRVVRNETINEDEYQYIRPYKKTINPFTVEVSSAVFASAENSPLEYVIKNFYPRKELYPEQIQKLQLFIEELATLKEAKQIIENYKKEYQQYLGDVPPYIMEEDEVGFYSKLGFANVDESAISVEYKFAYTSNGGMAKRTFTVPMTEETIVELINALEDKLTVKAFTKEQRALMTNKLREFIKKRDNFTCCNCRNSIFAEPNLLLEIDHILPVSKGGYTTEENLQTLCWKCNRSKSNKI